MLDKINEILSEIYASTQKRKSDSLSLQVGEAGCCLFEKAYIEHFNPDNTFERFQDSVAALAENSIGFNYPTFCSGKAGINWFFAYLNKENILNAEDLEAICDDDRLLATEAMNFLSSRKYDFLHGGIGIAYYLLYSRGMEYELFFEAFINGLDKAMYYNDDQAYLIDFDISKNILIPNQVNFGLAHGLPSVLKFLIECYKKSIFPGKAKEMAVKIINFLRRHANPGKNGSHYPSSLSLTGGKVEYSRLGWCYGDLGIGIILYHAGIAFDDDELIEHATYVLLCSTERRSFEQTQVLDAGLCHGAAGIAHIYNKMWHVTKKQPFKDACDFWIQETINLSAFQDGIGGYKSYEASTKSYVGSYNLLDGSCGIGLALLTYISGNFDWDYCLMLND